MHGDYVLAMYLAGLAVECVLQAFAIREGAKHDARHDLPKWLLKCPSRLRDVIKGEVGGAWSQLVALWDNDLRYLSVAGLLGYLRDKKADRRISGGPAAIVRQNARRVVDAATIIHNKGIALWVSSTKK